MQEGEPRGEQGGIPCLYTHPGIHLSLHTLPGTPSRVHPLLVRSSLLVRAVTAGYWEGGKEALGSVLRIIKKERELCAELPPSVSSSVGNSAQTGCMLQGENG